MTPALETTSLRRIGLVLCLALALPACGEPPRFAPDEGELVLATRLLADAEGRASTAMHLRKPCVLFIALTPPWGASAEADLGPPAALSGAASDSGAEPGGHWTARAGEPPHRVAVFAPGLYALRLRLLAPVPGSAVDVRVTAQPSR